MTEEKNTCGCGCGCEEHDHDEDFVESITLTLDNGEELICEVIGVFDVDDQSYIALDPGEKYDNQVFLYAFADEDEEEVELTVIEDDEEFDRVVAAFEALMDEAIEEE